MNNKPTFAFFGTPEFAAIILDELAAAGFVPSVIVTTPDKPVGRNLVVTPPEVAAWAKEHTIPFLPPKKLDVDFITVLKTYGPFDFFIVASYGKIIPQAVLDIPVKGSLNVHPSLLPKLRGASPIESAILHEEKTGVTIMEVDAEMDHGNIVAQKEIVTAQWPEYFSILEKTLAHEGGKLLTSVIPDWINGSLKSTPQDHSLATFCTKIKKEDALLNLSDPAEINLRKIRAYNVWPRAYYFLEVRASKIRIVVTKAHTENNVLVIDKIIPEGKKEMLYTDFMRNLAQ